MDKIVVTRHKALVEFLIKKGHVDKDTQHLSHVNKEDITGKHVYGLLPLWLACFADRLTEVQLRLPADKRGKELSLKEIEFYAIEPRTYQIREVKG